MEIGKKYYQVWQSDPRSWFGVGGFLIGIFGIILSLLHVFPLGSVNLIFFTALFFLAALYRPNWCFLFLVAVIPFEVVSVLPVSFGFSLRPYQWLFLVLGAALIIRVVSARTRWPLFQYSPLDAWLALIPLGALLSGSLSGGEGMRLAAIVLSFYMLYLLSRVFLKTTGDIRIAFTTLSASGLAVLGFSILQNLAFERGVFLQTVMPGRPNGTFAEPDWLGLFATLLLLLAFASLYRVLKNDSVGTLSFPVRIFLHSLLLLPILITLILTVSRSAWLSASIALVVWTGVVLFSEEKEALRRILQSIQLLSIACVIALLIIVDVPLTRFDLLNRAQSTATGLQEITVACAVPTDLPAEIESVDDLRSLGCRHINLEERAELSAMGLSVQTTHRPDPNVVIRSEIYHRTWTEIQAHPVLGIGWGNIGTVLGRDENGAAYNASNVWLEILLGAGLLGLIGLAGALGFIVYRATRILCQSSAERALSSYPALILALVTAFLVFNLFNAGLLIGFVWIFLAALPALLGLNYPKRT